MYALRRIKIITFKSEALLFTVRKFPAPNLTQIFQKPISWKITGVNVIHKEKSFDYLLEIYFRISFDIRIPTLEIESEIHILKIIL